MANATPDLSNSSETNYSLNRTLEEPLALAVPITAVYVVIFISGLVGNVSTCVVVARNRSMHTATNYYLFSLAISDLVLLISGLPPEMYKIWSPNVYVFGEAFCVLQGFAAETSANATVLTITAFTFERYIAICHPFLSHTMSKLSRAVKFIVAIWVLALCLAAPQAMQFGVTYTNTSGGRQPEMCTVISKNEHAFEISTFVFFVGPMTLISVLYVLIALRLHKSSRMPTKKRMQVVVPEDAQGEWRVRKNNAAQKRVINMLVAVVVAFFLCWAPFHSQRLLAMYLSNASEEAQKSLETIYDILTYASGILYFLSTTINPVLYNIMSKRFREAFKSTLTSLCSSRDITTFEKTYSALSRVPTSTKPPHNPLQRDHQQQFPELPRQNSRNNNSSTVLLKNLPSKNATPPANPPPLGNSPSPQKNLPLKKNFSSEKTTKKDATTSAKSDVFKEKSDIFRERRLGVFARGVLGVFRRENGRVLYGDIRRQTSTDSANTISNSSLQDMEETEFTSVDLVNFMGQVNGHIA